MKARLRVVPTAERHIRTASEWWDDNRTAAPDLLRSELRKAFDLLISHPEIAPRAKGVSDSRIRALHLSRIHYYLYYRVGDGEVEERVVVEIADRDGGGLSGRSER